jgi:hypothetical protein
MPLAGAGTLELEIPESLILLGFSSRAGGWRCGQSDTNRSHGLFAIFIGKFAAKRPFAFFLLRTGEFHRKANECEALDVNSLPATAGNSWRVAANL